MFARLKNAANGVEVNVNVTAIKTFAPVAEGTGSSVHFVDGSAIAVTDSCRSIRGYVKKALFAMHTGGAGPEEAAEPAS